MAARGKAKTLATFEDRAGRSHRVVLMANRLVLDLVGSEPPRVVAMLRYDEGIAEAETIVFGNEGEEGYAARASRETAPLCRTLEQADLGGPDEAPGEQPGEDEWPAASRTPPG